MDTLTKQQALQAKLAKLSPEQRRALLERMEKSRAGTSKPANNWQEYGSLTKAFEHTVTRFGERTALQFASETSPVSMTYRELNARANQLAHYLSAHYLSAQDLPQELLIGIMCERSPDVIVAILATLKAGAAYVPVDPNTPVSRLAHILCDSKVTTLITEKGVLQQLANEHAAQPWETPALNVLCLDDATVQQAVAQCAGHNLAAAVEAHIPDSDLSEQDAKISSSNNSPNNSQSNTGQGTPEQLAALQQQLAYIIYTSGSTGLPKGVWQCAAVVLCLRGAFSLLGTGCLDPVSLLRIRLFRMGNLGRVTLWRHVGDIASRNLPGSALGGRCAGTTGRNGI